MARGGGGGGGRLQWLTQLPAPRLIHSRGAKDRLEDLATVDDTRGMNEHALGSIGFSIWKVVIPLPSFASRIFGVYTSGDERDFEFNILR